MNRRTDWFGVLLALALLLAAFAGAQAKPAAHDPAAHIANAESAAPAAISHAATIMGWDEEGMPTVVLRAGTNGWTCYDDWPASPGNDPVCYDAVFDAWNLALMAGEEPEVGGTGIGYMLQGGSDPSNTDPFAIEPAKGEEWISTPPHIMIVTPVGFDAGDYAGEPQQDEPYIMWDGTPFEHLMVPVVPTADELLGDVDEATANTMRSSPAGVALNATIMGYPEQEGGDMVVVQEGTNGWTCWPDNPTSPGNDPSCNDAMMEAFWSIGDTQSVERVGFSYMLQGGSDASNTDPSLMAPPEGEEWVYTPPHVMLVIPGGFDEGHFTTDHMSGYPYVMFSETGYEHLMIPIAEMPEMDMGREESASADDLEALKAEVIALEFATFDHLRAHDADAVRAETSEDFIMIGADGTRGDRQSYVDFVADTNYEFDEPVRSEPETIVISPDAVLVIYTMQSQGKFQGEPFTNQEHLSSLWQKRAGKWLNTFLQASPIGAAQEGGANDAQIVNAMSAAPAAIAKEATIMGWGDGGMPTVLLREGANGWTCLADWPVSPGNDPQCFDRIWTAWNEAYMAGEEPAIPGLGIGYMLQGGSDPSNTDPLAIAPAPGDDWITSPAHVMFLLPGGFDAADFSTTPSMDEPYIMWDGTPYEHLMVPVAPITAEQMGDVDADMQNTMSSAPASIALNATIMGGPTTEGGDMVVLREGTNGWVCYPDRAVSPGNDPSCNDATLEAGFATGTAREVTRVGLSYMLQGGSDESNSDPTASGPAAGEDWITTPPHVMVMAPGGLDASYFTTDHASGYPYIMYTGTDYEHLMIPVADMPEMDMSE